ncbi:4-amino-4-deoxychorismate lyase [Paludibacter jiangxiensis]|uniref:4-amino-4-deoxychorismate lyase n=2 Tax=Paludibacter jiangxiensis TaxID=681398 RepID=A0A161M5Q1_9BACT|nr:4-amino-4-deoxychorismate lyase [Paludibacter jiangxiensis]
MCLLLESIKVENGRPCNLEDHINRMNNSRRCLFGIQNPIILSDQLFDKEIKGVAKCRIVYSETIHSVDSLPYTPRLINTLYLIEKNDIDYTYKYADRSAFQNLPAHAPDEDFLIVKNGYITDTTFSNIVFFDGNQWVTPSTYLLNGTQRQRLLREGRIVSRNIKADDLDSFLYARLINAMLDFDSAPFIEMSAIRVSQ